VFQQMGCVGLCLCRGGGGGVDTCNPIAYLMGMTAVGMGAASAATTCTQYSATGMGGGGAIIGGCGRGHARGFHVGVWWCIRQQ
jgi:hypothetical protein